MKTVKEGTWAIYRGTGRCEIYTGNNYRQGDMGYGLMWDSSVLHVSIWGAVLLKYGPPTTK